MEEADAHQLGKTVDLLSTVHNVKQALIRICPCLKHVFAPTLHDYIGEINQFPYLCISFPFSPWALNPRLTGLCHEMDDFV
jgi:hypothetical protein